MGFAAFERKWIKSACSGLVQIPFSHYDQRKPKLCKSSGSYLPLFNQDFQRLLESKAITFMAPRWISQHKGPGRSTLLSPLWRSLKQQVRELQKSYPDANSEWLLNKVIEQNLT
jgi:hypothetical protein